MNVRAPAARPQPVGVAKGPTPSLVQNTQSAHKSACAVASKAPQPDAAPRVTVCVRKRPLNPKEEAAAETDIVSVVSGSTVHVYEPKIKVDLTKHVVQHEFMFDSAFNEDSSNSDVFQRTAQPLVEFVVSGGKVSKFTDRPHPHALPPNSLASLARRRVSLLAKQAQARRTR
jgi:hypothetical protein